MTRNKTLLNLDTNSRSPRDRRFIFVPIRVRPPPTSGGANSSSPLCPTRCAALRYARDTSRRRRHVRLPSPTARSRLRDSALQNPTPLPPPLHGFRQSSRRLEVVRFPLMAARVSGPESMGMFEDLLGFVILDSVLCAGSLRPILIVLP
ncbi:hypothetical protein B296_00034369 [Ensete ventricosum]|uniref:Uncharacterized protein n=1 Tax=Ensete ventricosum TaxID=4639 RepID=A0A426YP91_ENSVE|nr:hypothetical protein B296_00034369 [Ensete ventricosum]